MADGLSNTLGVSEVKAFTPYLRDGGNPSGVAAVPTSPSQLASFGGEFKVDSGHTYWNPFSSFAVVMAIVSSNHRFRNGSESDDPA